MPRKGENIYKRKDKRWEGRYSKGRDESGRIRYGYVYGKTYKDVKEKLTFTKLEMAGGYTAEKKITFSKVCDEWMKKEVLQIKHSSYVKYNTVLNKHLLPYMGNVLLSEINACFINEFIREKLVNGKSPGIGLSQKTVRDIVSLLKSILKYASQEYGYNNSQGNIVIPKTEDREVPVLTKIEQKKLESYLMNDSRNPRKVGVLICLYTGLRLGEICALRWKDIALDKGILKVNYTMQRIKKLDNTSISKTHIIIDSPKTKHSRREIPIPHFLLKMLKKIKMRDDTYFLSSETEHYVEPRNMEYFFEKCILSSGISKYRFHDLRHTFASRCVECGFDVKCLSEILGHSNTSITLNYYVHVSMESKRRQMNLLAVQ